ncbi:hypothetical protein MLD38_016082 [Melastoma candidum]|uniref:Uncharacterized protein n=1 Tax=Melastoma candidum TaxID=119954 RepID=A0ACB9RI42_9MYRT|nr:hypothetical protein MLD38_016082 [Melastoma candidum]
MQGQLSARQSRRRGGPPGTTTTYKARAVEAAGRATADCAAVWCCCPCGIANVILFAVYRIPAGICRRAIRSRRQRRKGRGMLGKGGGCQCDMCEGFSVVGTGGDGGGIVMLGDLLKMKSGYGDDGAGVAEGDGNEEVRLLDEEMLKKFNETGFWRSPSRVY